MFGGHRHVEFVFDEDTSQPGQRVRGQATVYSALPWYYRSIVMDARGQQSLHFKQTVTGTLFIKHVKMVPSDGWCTWVAAGKHVVDFEVELPARTPDSVDTRCASVKYAIVMHINGFVSSSVHEGVFMVAKMHDYGLPVHVDRVTDCGGHGTVHLMAATDQSTYKPGQAINLTVKCNLHDAKTDMIAIKYSLKQTNTIRSGRQQRVHARTLQRWHFSKVGQKGGVLEFEDTLGVPEDLPPSSSSARYKCEYRLVVRANMGGVYHKVATIPLKAAVLLESGMQIEGWEMSAEPERHESRVGAVSRARSIPIAHPAEAPLSIPVVLNPLLGESLHAADVVDSMDYHEPAR